MKGRKRIATIIFLKILTPSAEAKNAHLPEHERKVIAEVAQEYGLNSEQTRLLYVIRRIEQGGQGREFGVLHPKAINTTFRNQAQWAAGTIKKRYNGDLKAFAQRWCPVGAANDPKGLNKNWYKNAVFYMAKERP